MYLNGFKPVIFLTFAAACLFTACSTQVKTPVQICPGKTSAAESVAVLKQRSSQQISLKANGKCHAQFYIDDKLNDENFPIKIWVDSPDSLRFQGDLFLNPSGLILGTDADNFWLALKPNEIDSYISGQWSEQSKEDKLLLDPRMILEAIGLIQIDNSLQWSLLNRPGVDILIGRDVKEKWSKTIYIDNCDYRIMKIEYLSDDKTLIVSAELTDYKEVTPGFTVPQKIKITAFSDGPAPNKFEITLDSVKQTVFTSRQKNVIFTKPDTKGFKNIYRLINGQLVKQPQ